MSSSNDEPADSNIQVFLRVRPSKKPSGYFQLDDLEKNRIIFSLPDNFKSDYVNNSKLKYSFEFNGLIDMAASQEDVFKRVGVPAVQNAIDGFNSTIFAYGQTGSGKTFTLTGGPESYKDRGLIPRTISMLFNESRTRTDVQFKFYISYLEIYNDEGYDLLDQSSNRANKGDKGLEQLPKVSILEDEHGNYHLKNLSMHEATSEEEALNLLFVGDTNRAIAETPMNMASSRSHCIFSIGLETKVVGSDKVRRSKLHLVDLAGSERVAKTNSSGSVLTEAKYINTSLFFLEMVIVALYEKATKGRAHVPYRNSMMTSVLRDSLGGNCKTMMIATINPEASHTEESLSTCRFAQRVSLIKNKASINEEMDPNLVIKRLKGELLTLREEVNYLKGETGEGEELSPQELEDLRAMCRQYAYDRDPAAFLNVGALTLTKIKEVFKIFKDLVQEAAAEGGGGGGRGGGPSGKGGGAEGLSAEDLAELERYRQQVRDMKSLLVQRDSEINILVNMVKKNKTVDLPDNYGGGGGNGEGGELNFAMIKEQLQQQPAQPKPRGPPRQAQAKDEASNGRMSKELQARIIERHLFGVPPPPDVKIFEDSEASFNYFKERSSVSGSINENKEILKAKINEAKTLGLQAEQSRKTIEYLKKTIETIRRDRALQGLNNIDGLPDQPNDSPEEESHRRAIEQEKVVYTDSVSRLKELKPQIEHIKKLIEKCQAQISSQFSQWYETLHSRPDFLQNFLHNPAANLSAEDLPSASSSGRFATSSSAPESKAERKYSAEEMSAKFEKDSGNSAKFSQPTLSVSQSVDSSPLVRSQRPQVAASLDSKSQDEAVNEDIMAFYAAKNELLKKRGSLN